MLILGGRIHLLANTLGPISVQKCLTNSNLWRTCARSLALGWDAETRRFVGVAMGGVSGEKAGFIIEEAELREGQICLHNLCLNLNRCTQPSPYNFSSLVTLYIHPYNTVFY